LEFGIEEEEELSGGGDEGDFGWFSEVPEMVIEELEVAVFLADGGEGGEVEGAADSGAAAAEMALALAGAAVVGIRGEAGQGGDFLSIDATEFGEQSEQGRSGYFADAVLSEKELVAGGQDRVLGDDLPGGILELGVRRSCRPGFGV